MAGQGRPRRSRFRFAWHRAGKATLARSLSPGGLAYLVAALRLGRLGVAAVYCTRAAGDEMRLRIAWGGGVARQWQGTISVTEGSVSEPRPLGIEADEPGSMWIDRSTPAGAVVIRQRSPRGYDGLDLLVSAPATGRLLLQLSAADDEARPAPI